MPTTLITGANRGIGLELAKQAMADGPVIGTARDPKAAQHLIDAGVRVVELDAADEASIKALAVAVGDEPIDLLINNAGVFPDNGKTFEDLDLETMTGCLRTNVAGPIGVTRSLLPNLLRSEHPKVVHVSSTMGSLELAQEATKNHAYRASKAALNMVTVLMANELRERGVCCVCVHPGWVQTDMGGAKAALTPEQSARDILGLAHRLGMAESGSFLRHDGEALPW
ncbi:MAG: SDR family oxidoreductase [Planctomycetota bacterium]